MELKECYKILGVDEKTPFEEITKKWKELVKQLHPDHYGDLPPEAIKTLEDKLKIINEAYNLLKEAHCCNYKIDHNEASNEFYSNKNSYDYLSMVNKAKSYLWSLLEGNQINYEEFNVEGLQFSNYKLYIEYKYKFKIYEKSWEKAGGKAAEIPCDSKSSFETAKNTSILYALSSNIEKESFVNLVLADVINYFSENKEYLIWKSPVISYSYECLKCGGMGVEFCNRCKGSGYVRCNYCYGKGTIKRGKTFEICSHCHGKGILICSRCNGSGKVKCSHCSGHGFFTIYYECYLNAEPERTLKIDNGLRYHEVLNFINSKNNKEIIDIATPKFIKYDLNAENCCFYLESSLHVVEAKITVKNNEYTEVLVNDVLGILKPPIFDDLLSNKLQDISTLKKKGLNKLLEYFNYLKSFKTIDEILKSYKETKDSLSESKKNYLKAQLINKTGGYISDKFSEQLAENLVKLMKILSPHNTPLVWGICFFICIILEMIGIFFDIPEMLKISGHGPWISYFAVPLYISTIFTFIISPFAIFINKIVTENRQKYIPEEYRSKVYHKNSIFSVILLIFIFYFLFTGLIKYAQLNKYEFYLNAKQYIRDNLKPILSIIYKPIINE